MPVANAALTDEQRTHFLEHGWLRIPKAVPPEHIARFVGDVWIRLGYDREDPSTWVEEKFRMPRQREMLWKDFSPKAWSAICEVVGGEDRIDPTIFDKVGDSLIANFGTEEWRDKTVTPRELTNWHVDGNWFTHFLDSSEQSLFCVLLFNDIIPRAGGTWMCEDGIKHVAKWLYDRPQGCIPKLIDPDGSNAMNAIQQCNEFVEATGEAGDVFICHGFMPHSASRNHLRIPRFITSPKIVLKEPFNYNRENPEDYSLVEQKTLRELGVSSLPDWKITAPRARFTPANNAPKDSRLPLELQRMKDYAAKTGGVVDSIHVNGIAKYNGWTEPEPSKEST
ncbi:hypothetical protein K439DRAFT_1633385 [Ramaria rubella]|nr:hypothetical protein K439DRAFT_1633385 [Ramaria rubella]